MDRDEVKVHKLARKERGKYQAILHDQTNLVNKNKGFIIRRSGTFFMRDTAGSRERARWLYLARSGNQSHRAI